MKKIKNAKPIKELIEKRCSWRKYSAREIPGPVKGQIMEQIALPHKGPLGNRVRFGWVDADFGAQNGSVKLGTYGFIAGARHFIAGAVKPGPGALADYGYLMEQLILFLTGLDLATCWLGGTFKRGQFAGPLDISDDEIIPAVTPVGYPSRKRGLRDRVLRTLAGSQKRKPWDELFFCDDFATTLTPARAGQFQLPLEMLRLAPSASNRQPWRVLLQGNRIHLFLERTPNYDKIVKTVDLQRIDMGIAMCHFGLTAAAENLPGAWAVAPDPPDEVPGKTYIATWS